MASGSGSSGATATATRGQGGYATLQAIGYLLLLLLSIAALRLAAVAWGLQRINRGTTSHDDTEAAGQRPADIGQR